MVMQPNSQRALTTSYRSRSLLFSAAVRAEIKLDMKRPCFEKKGTIYLETTPKKKKRRSSLRKKSRSRRPGLAEEGIVDGSDPAASSTLTKKGLQ